MFWPSAQSLSGDGRGMFKLNRMTDYAIVVLGVLAHRQGEIMATAQLAELTSLNQPTVAKVAKTLLRLICWTPNAVCMAAIVWHGRPR